MRILIYKRTHTGDPDESGCFGVYHCMGRVRDRSFDAVIGVGGISREPVAEGIDRRITWIGIGPQQIGTADDGYPIWAFERFYLKDQKGGLLSDKAPALAKRMFSNYGPRTAMAELTAEIDAILKLARNAPPSPALFGNKPKTKRCNDSTKRIC